MGKGLRGRVDPLRFLCGGVKKVGARGRVGTLGHQAVFVDVPQPGKGRGGEK